MPFLRLHPEQQVVPAYACIVHQHADVLPGVGGFPAFHGCLAGSGIRDVELQQFAVRPRSPHALKRDLSFPVIGNIVDYYPVTVFGKSYADSPPYATASARDEGEFFYLVSSLNHIIQLKT